MEITFEEPQLLDIQNTYHNYVHYPNNTVYDIYLKNDGLPYFRYAEVSIGVWTDLTWSTEALLIEDNSDTVKSISVIYYPDYITYFIFELNNGYRIVPMPMAYFGFPLNLKNLIGLTLPKPWDSYKTWYRGLPSNWTTVTF